MVGSSLSVYLALPINRACHPISSFAYAAQIPSALVDSPSSGILSAIKCNSVVPAITFNVLVAKLSVSKSDIPSCDVLSPDPQCSNLLSLGILDILNSFLPPPPPATPTSRRRTESWTSLHLKMLCSRNSSVLSLVSKKNWNQFYSYLTAKLYFKTV